MVKVYCLTSESQESGEIFDFPEDSVKMSKTLVNMMEDFGYTEDGDNDDLPSIPVNNMTSEVLKKVIDFCNHHKDSEKTEYTRDEEIDVWDKNFCNVSQSELFEFILAANYLDIKLLLSLTCKSVAEMIKGRSVEEIRATFNIENDFTKEEEEALRKENEWLTT